MTGCRRIRRLVIPAAAALLLMAGEACAQKYGGTLRLIHREDPADFGVHEHSGGSEVFPSMPLYNNLVLFDPLKPQESVRTILPELARGWSWSADARALTFTLREGVRWQDGRPFVAADVRHTFDGVRGATKSTGMKLNPRKDWYANVAEIATNGDREVTFRLKRPQPALVILLASGFSPVYPAHVPMSEMRTRPVGTGPYRLARYENGKTIDLAKNPDYFVKGRPYLDGIRFAIIRNRGTRHAALQAGQADMSWPFDLNEAARRQLEKAAPQLVFDRNASNLSTNLLMNPTKPPFNDARLRKVVQLAMDREALIKSVYQGSAVKGGAMLPKPWGVWGLPEDRLAKVPGLGDVNESRETARQIMRQLGYGPEHPLTLVVSTRATAFYVDMATWVVEQLRHVWIEGTLEQVENAMWGAKRTRGDYTIAANLTGVGVDEPDANFFENYACKSPRNYSRYCNPELEKKMLEQSSETDSARRLKLVHEIDIALQEDGARPILTHNIEYTAYYPYVKNFVNHQTTYSIGRFQEVWLDK
ncbi:MAG: peptide ABC transporter substrate-binding protein [Candidatus Lambdaproteobacteria bacterium]|nr:peptide ABC transporter substrate-binding protein [Candidatus Lambdaproteobacteria bacterium]